MKPDSPKRYAEIIASFKGKGVLVTGDIILDRYIFGRVNRISPEAPVPVVEVVEEVYRLGGAANVANNIISLGGRAAVAGIAGSDTEGENLLGLCREQGIDTAGIIIDNRPTTVKTRIVAHNQQVVRVDKEDASIVGGATYKRLVDYIKKASTGFQGLIISDYRKGVVTSSLVRAIVSASKGKLVALDPKAGNFQCYKGVSVITPNLKEASEGSGILINNEDSLIQSGKRLLRDISCKAVLITKGEEGMSLFERERKDTRISHIPVVAKKVFDVTGAGDTVIAVLTLAYASGASLYEAAFIANCAAGIVVGEVGTAAVTPNLLLHSIESLF